MITPEEQTILEHLDFEPEAVPEVGGFHPLARLASAAGAVACLAVAYPVAEQFPMAPPAWFVGAGLVAAGLKLAYDAIRGR